MSQLPSDLTALREMIRQMHALASAIKEQAGAFPALRRNADRILAGISMLELNLPEIEEEPGPS